MDKMEKELYKKVSTYYVSPSKTYDFTHEESLILERWRVHKIINEDAFENVTSISSDHQQYLQTRKYPFTSYGDEEFKKNWYLQFRNSNPVIVIRDILTIVAFSVSLYLAIMESVTKNIP